MLHFHSSGIPLESSFPSSAIFGTWVPGSSILGMMDIYPTTNQLYLIQSYIPRVTLKHSLAYSTNSLPRNINQQPEYCAFLKMSIIFQNCSNICTMYLLHKRYSADSLAFGCKKTSQDIVKQDGTTDIKLEQQQLQSKSFK